MNYFIFEISETPFQKKDWISLNSVLDENYSLPGADWVDDVESPETRTDAIRNFFQNIFPDNSFKIIDNKIDKTAEIEFVGDLQNLLSQWKSQLLSFANAITDDVNDGDVWRLKRCCERPFDIGSKFYFRDRTEWAAPVNEFFNDLKYIAAEHQSKPFRLYVGQVFKFHE